MPNRSDASRSGSRTWAGTTPDRSHSWAATAVRDCEGLVQIQVRNIRADFSWLHQAHERVHVCAVQINLAALVVRHLADLAQRVFKDTVRRRIRDHAGGEARAGRLGFAAKVLKIDIAVRGRLNDDDFHARHLR